MTPSHDSHAARHTPHVHEHGHSHAHAHPGTHGQVRRAGAASWLLRSAFSRVGAALVLCVAVFLVMAWAMAPQN